jgi:catechol 2,3-dioxygenase-like lactoylglutathione lyase family enzyme
MSEVERISAVTLIVKDMNRSCRFYSNVPGFKLTYGGSSADSFTTYQIGRFRNITFLNLELQKSLDSDINENNNKNHFSRTIFYTENVDKLHSYFKDNRMILNLIELENEPVNAAWNERYFHMRDPDGFQLSFAQPTKTMNQEFVRS